ncbi:hypothetical protein ACERK3_04805 [Phycisphaerales bacterium AB-hyl4]|uniref:CopG family transcriptional regulator n=1 Tax=Natronomicrosphaera hydrolytica TaxID=3242702 RepID=A0ABV4U351_9BACT
MPRKKTINLAIPEPLLEEFNEVCRHYGHAKQKGLVLSAAILMFLEADPAEQGESLERILISDVRAGVDSMIHRAKQEQLERINQRETPAASPAKTPADEPLQLAKAAKKARPGKKAVGRILPTQGE